jgi:hypothetical protein
LRGHGVRHTGLLDLSGAHVQVERELLIKILIEAPPMGERSESLDQPGELRQHYAVRITSAMAPDS